MNGSDRQRLQYNENFLAALEVLNPQQRKAVEQIEGPVLVVAGPGTGKTHILSSRIGKILLETDAQASNILCLTFTDAGVRAMRSRLLSLIGPEAHRVHIYTFHSFCNSIIQDNLERFGRQDLEPVSELEKIELIRSLIDSLDIEHRLKKGRSDIYFYENHLQDLFQKMKMENWSVSFVHEKIDTFLEELLEDPDYRYKKNGKDYKKGDLRKTLYDPMKKRMELLRAAAALYPKYQAALKRARRYDYDDMILWVLKAFEKNDNLLRTYQEQYLYFLVDEYQDTNGAQNKILMQLAEFWEVPNIFIVGDDDQSIFEFQGARLKNLLDFYDWYQSKLALVVLTNNYRSTQPVLDNAQLLINNNEKRIIKYLGNKGVDKTLIASHPEVKLQVNRPRIWEYPNRIQEEIDLVLEIKKLIEAGVAPESIAVIYAKHKQSDELIVQLEKNKLPYNTKKRINILNLPLIKNLRTILAYIQQEYIQPESGEEMLFKMLHFSFWDIPVQDIYKLGAYQAKARGDKRQSWYQLIQDEKTLQGIGLKQPEAVLNFSAALQQFQQNLLNEGLTPLVEGILNRSGLLSEVLQQPDKIWLLQVVNTFLDFVKLEVARNPRIDLAQFLETLKRMDANRLSLEVFKTLDAGAGVQLLTAHSAKGLEFDYVFMMDCVKKNWEPRTRNSSYRFYLPRTLTYSGEEDALEARRRLFYVAMTRAKISLTLSYSSRDRSDRDLEPAIFIEELKEGQQIAIEARTLSSEQLTEATALALQTSEVGHFPQLDKAYISDLLEDFVLSASALNRYQYCPISFLYVHVLRAPTVMSEAAAYGTAMHNTLQLAFEHMLDRSPKTFPNERIFLEMFEQEMDKLRAYFPRQGNERRLEMGKRYLQRYYQQYVNSWPKEVKVEHKVQKVEIDGVPIKGVIDRMDFKAHQKMNIVDYKTGTHNDTKTKPPTKANPLGGTYWRQMNFYKLLVENDTYLNRTVDTATIAYLEPDQDNNWKSTTVRTNASDQKTVRQMIVDTYKNIQAQNFYEGCGEPHCEWCNFLKHQQPRLHNYDQIGEELDD